MTRWSAVRARAGHRRLTRLGRGSEPATDLLAINHPELRRYSRTGLDRDLEVAAVSPIPSASSEPSDRACDVLPALTRGKALVLTVVRVIRQQKEAIGWARQLFQGLLASDDYVRHGSDAVAR